MRSKRREEGVNFRPTHVCNSTAHEQQSGGHGSKMSTRTTAHPDTGAACGRAVWPCATTHRAVLNIPQHFKHVHLSLSLTLVLVNVPVPEGRG